MNQRLYLLGRNSESGSKPGTVTAKDITVPEKLVLQNGGIKAPQRSSGALRAGAFRSLSLECGFSKKDIAEIKNE